ncbi:MAG: hypothetical protein H0T91_10835 [Propionibacteriaceae bacterium]|nr:hypothetical protein [Propionibacteriaceae bacterium]
MFGVYKYEVGTTSEKAAGSVESGLAASNGYGDELDAPELMSDKPEPGAGLVVGTGDVSGNRSPPGRGSVLAQSESPGPTSSGLAKLYGDVDQDSAIVDRFVTDYLALLDDRLLAIRRLMVLDDEDEAVVSILSLETTSAMIGAQDVVNAARTLRRAVEQRQGIAAQPLFETLISAVTSMRDGLVRDGFSDRAEHRPAGG